MNLQQTQRCTVYPIRGIRNGIFKSKAAFPLTRLNGHAGERARSAARQKPFHWRVETRRRCDDIVPDCPWYL